MSSLVLKSGYEEKRRLESIRLTGLFTADELYEAIKKQGEPFGFDGICKTSVRFKLLSNLRIDKVLPDGDHWVLEMTATIEIKIPSSLFFDDYRSHVYPSKLPKEDIVFVVESMNPPEKRVKRSRNV